jgi:nucleoside 2-deoxyribosyltransferase
MPFSADMEDVFYYGIQKPVRELGYICERVDQAAFTGDILQQVRSRIEDADIVIADLTSANPNVYLEVGYAWGKSRPTVLLIKDPEQLRFDVRGQRCLAYKTIKELELRLTTELNSLNAAVRDTPS